MSEGRSVASRLSLVGFAYLLLFLPFFGFLSPKSAGVIVPLATVLILSGWLLDKKSLGGLRSNVWWVVLAIGGLVTIGVVRAPDTDIAIDRLLKLAVFLPGGILLVLISAQSFDMRGEWSRKCLLIGFGLGMILLAWAVLSFGPLGEILPPSLQYIQGFSGENRGAVLLVGLTTAAFSRPAIVFQLGGDGPPWQPLVRCYCSPQVKQHSWHFLLGWLCISRRRFI